MSEEHSLLQKLAQVEELEGLNEKDIQLISDLKEKDSVFDFSSYTENEIENLLEFLDQNFRRIERSTNNFLARISYCRPVSSVSADFI